MLETRDIAKHRQQYRPMRPRRVKMFVQVQLHRDKTRVSKLHCSAYKRILSADILQTQGLCRMPTENRRSSVPKMRETPSAAFPNSASELSAATAEGFSIPIPKKLAPLLDVDILGLHTGGWCIMPNGIGAPDNIAAMGIILCYYTIYKCSINYNVGQCPT